MTNSHTPAQKLYLAYPTSQPDLSKFNIKTQEKHKFLDTSFTFTVIGSSHCITADSIGFYEILSCEPIDVDVLRTIPLDTLTQEQTQYKINDTKLTVSIEGKPLSSFPDPTTQDISYQFAENAFTTINLINDHTYETYHTYPEYNLALYSKNTFQIE